MMQTYQQLSPEAQKQVDDLLHQLTAQAKEKVDEKKPSSIFGILKGKIEMAPDFDEPLEDFKDYM